MKTETTEKPVARAIEALPTLEIPVEDIHAAVQHRRFFDEKKIKDLAGNMAKVGVLQPLLVRAGEDKGAFRLVAGERRLRAARLAGIKVVPCRVGMWDDREAAEIQAFENLHRQDLTPMEEARAFKTLTDEGGFNVESLAERIDKSIHYVYRAVALLELVPKALQALEEGKITPAHGHQLLRAPKGAQEKLTSWLVSTKRGAGVGVPTVMELRREIEVQVGRDLAKASFPKDVPYAGQRSCVGCPFNSAEQVDLFDSVEKGRCTNAGCFDAKAGQSLNDMKDEAADRFKALPFAGVVSDLDGLIGYYGKFKGGQVIDEGALRTTKMKEAMAKTPDGFAWGFISPKYAHQGPPRAVVIAKTKGAKPEGAKLSPSEKKAREAQIKKNFIARRVSDALGKAGIQTVATFGKGHMAAIVARMPYMNKDTRDGLERCMTMPKERGELKELVKLDEKALRALAFGQAMWGYGEPEEDVLELVGVNVKKITTAATAAALKEWDAKKGKKS